MASSTRSAQPDQVFPALLKHWRGQRGITQLDLSHIAEVSTRHLSFLETGRSRPSRDMVRVLCEVLDIPLRARNELLRAAGFEAAHPDSSPDELLAGPVGAAVKAMLAQHQPLPMLVMNRSYDVVTANPAAGSMLNDTRLQSDGRPNLLRMLFDDDHGPASVVNWNEVASHALRRLQRECMHAPHDQRLADLLDEILSRACVPTSWRVPDLAEPDQPVLTTVVRLIDGAELDFITTMTTFASPNNVAVDELVVEAWFAGNEQTRALCEARWGN